MNSESFSLPQLCCNQPDVSLTPRSFPGVDAVNWDPSAWMSPSCSLLPITPPSALRILAALPSSTRPLLGLSRRKSGVGSSHLEQPSSGCSPGSALGSLLSRPWLFYWENQLLAAEAPPLLPSLPLRASPQIPAPCVLLHSHVFNRKITSFSTRNSWSCPPQTLSINFS